MILWTDFLALALLALVLVMFRVLGRTNPVPPQVARLVRGIEVLMVLLLVAMFLMVRGQ
jgi:hypothetical protein